MMDLWDDIEQVERWVDEFFAAEQRQIPGLKSGELRLRLEENNRLLGLIAFIITSSGDEYSWRLRQRVIPTLERLSNLYEGAIESVD